MAKDNGKQVTGWVGWVYFAGFMMLITGILQMIAGFAALLNDKYYVVTPDKLVAFDYTTWGWVHIILGLVLTMAGTAVVNGHLWGRVIAIFLAALGIIANFVFLPAYPVWSLILITVYGLVIYALTVHGDEAEV